MAYGCEPWELDDWPAIWITRSLAVLEHVDEPPPFGELAQPGRGEDAQSSLP
jgi:hypothetical protein